MPFETAAKVLRVDNKALQAIISFYCIESDPQKDIFLEDIENSLSSAWTGDINSRPWLTELTSAPGKSLLTLSEVCQLSPEYVFKIASGELPVFRIALPSCSMADLILVPLTAIDQCSLDSGLSACLTKGFVRQFLCISRLNDIAKELGIERSAAASLFNSVRLANKETLYASVESRLFGEGMTPEAWHRLITLSGHTVSPTASYSVTGKGIMETVIRLNHLPGLLYANRRRALWEPAVQAMVKP